MAATTLVGAVSFGSRAAPSPRSFVRPPARYPGAIAGDLDLAVAVNRFQTTLTATMAAIDTVMTVADATSILPRLLLSIDDEIVEVLAAPSSNVVTVSRAFDGTTAAMHLQSAAVTGLIDAWHHNALASEVKAIEIALGPNLSHIPTSTFIISKTYDFAAQQPGGSLAIGNNVVTLSPVPLGINGADQHHYLYISGGTGAAEAVLITGGTAVSGGASGTVIINCANAHTGAWTLTSATAGLHEAIIANGSAGAAIWIPSGTHSMRAPIEVGGLHGLTIRGFGIGSTTLDIAHATNDLFVCSSQLNDFNLGDFSVTSSVTRTGGWVFHGSAPYNGNCFLCRSRLWRIDVKKQLNGFWFAQFNLAQVTECWLTAFVGSGGIAIKAGQTVPAGNTNNQGAGLYITDVYIYANDFIGSGPNQLSYGIWIEDCDAVEVNHAEVGGTLVRNVHMTSTGYRCSNHFFNEFVSDASGTGPGFYITGAASTVIQIDGSWFGSAGEVTNTPTASNLTIDAQTAAAIQIRNSIFQQSKGNAIRIDTGTHGAGVQIVGNYFFNNCTAANVGNNDTIYVNCGFNTPGPFLSSNDDPGNLGGGASLKTSGTANLLTVGDNNWGSGVNYGITPVGAELRVTTATMGGSPMTAGQTISINTIIQNASVGMLVQTTPLTYPGAGFIWSSYVSAANTVVTQLLCITAGTPTISSYALRLKS